MRFILVALLTLTGCVHVLSEPALTHPISAIAAEGFVCAGAIAIDVNHHQKNGYHNSGAFLLASSCTISFAADVLIEVMERNE